VGILLIRILDNLTLAQGWGSGVKGGSRKGLFSASLIGGAAACRLAGVARGGGGPVTTKLPLVVHLVAASLTCVGATLPRFSFRISVMMYGFGRLSGLSLSWARSTTKLGLGGLDPMIAEYTFKGALPLPRVAVGGWAWMDL
jgi:hypothetical protein